MDLGALLPSRKEQGQERATELFSSYYHLEAANLEAANLKLEFLEM
jgi:hypothetical protein